MTNPLFSGRYFITTVWRKQPLVLKGVIPSALREELTFKRFRRWCERSNRVRVYVRTEQEKPGRAVAKKLSCGSDGLVLYDHYSRQHEPITLLLNGTETVEPNLSRMHSFFCIPYEWRRDDIVATLSATDAGIGYHGGSEDGFIVQLEGERDWSVWSPDVLSESYKEFLCGSPLEPQVDARPLGQPILTTTLQPGDALYIPALFPHEGITRRESLSLSIGWRGISAYKALKEMLAIGNRRRKSVPVAYAKPLFRLLDDPPFGSEPRRYLSGEFVRLFETLPINLRPTNDEIAIYISRYLGKPAS